MFVRQFTTAASRRAITRTRYAPRPSGRASAKPPASPAAAARPAASRTPAAKVSASPSAAAPSAASASATSPAAANDSNKTESAPGFTPRLVPELKTQPSSTRVEDTIDPEDFVTSTENMEFNADVGLEPVNDWTTSFQGLGSAPFEPRVIDILLAPVVPEDVEITPDGLIYLPEIKYRRILNRAFGPGGWGIAPRSKTMVTQRQVTREYALVCLGRLVSVSRGEMDYFNAEGVTTAMEGCKSNALMRCCKDLGIASELWDPTFIRSFKSKYCDSKFFEKKRRFVWKRKDRAWEYPYV